MSRFTERHLDPASRLGEILFGFIMVLTVTLTAGFSVADGKRGVRQLLLAAVGSNVAWGIIDAAMYIMNSMVVRRGKVRLVEAVQHAPDQETALVLIQERIFTARSRRFGWSLCRVCRLQFHFSSSANRKLRCECPIFF